MRKKCEKPQIKAPRVAPIGSASTLVLAGAVSRDGLVAEYNFNGYYRYSNWNENDKLIYDRTVINL